MRQRSLAAYAADSFAGENRRVQIVNTELK
jgi:hypothetical protein